MRSGNGRERGGKREVYKALGKNGVFIGGEFVRFEAFCKATSENPGSHPSLQSD